MAGLKAGLAACVWVFAAMAMGSTGDADPAPGDKRATRHQIAVAKADSTIRTRGVSAYRVRPAAMGLTRRALPGAKFITFEQWKAMAAIPKTGLFIVGMGVVPRELPEALKEAGFELNKDGILVDREGRRRTLFVRTDSFRVAAAGGRFGCVSTSAWVVYLSGSCRDFEARAYVNAYASCARGSRAAYIELVEARVRLGRKWDSGSCRGCDDERARVKHAGLCYWPGNGSHGPAYYAYFGADGGDLRVVRRWSWRDR